MTAFLIIQKFTSFSSVNFTEMKKQSHFIGRCLVKCVDIYTRIRRSIGQMRAIHTRSSFHQNQQKIFKQEGAGWRTAILDVYKRQDEALEILKKKKNLRILRLPNIRAEIAADTLDMKKVMGGLLVQTLDQSLTNEWTVVTDRAPSEKEKADLMLAWQIVKHTKSNAIALAKDNVSVGIGPGQVNRIWAVEQSIEHAGERAKGAALASDAFFPFDDCVRAAGKAGITCIIQPGGSVRDQESIDAANELGIAMVFTGMRHFKH